MKINNHKGDKTKDLKKVAGTWRKTTLDDDKIWKKVFRRKSRKRKIR